MPTSERQLRGSTNIKQLDDEEQEGMRVVGKVRNKAFTYLMIDLNLSFMSLPIDKVEPPR